MVVPLSAADVVQSQYHCQVISAHRVGKGVIIKIVQQWASEWSTVLYHYELGKNRVNL